MQSKLIHGLASLLLPLGLYGATPSNNAGAYYRPNLRVSASRLTSPISGQPQLAAFADVLDLSGFSPSAEPSLLATNESELTLFTPASELLIIDAAVPDKHLLLQNLKPGVDVQVIAGDADGLEQLERILSTRSNISALHIVSHASDGVLQLGNTAVTRELLHDRLTVLATLDKALVDGADLLLYGCDLAETERGEALLALIANESNVDVAASNDLTGNAALGGDWDLEIVLGDIDTERAFTDRALMDFSAILQTAFEFDTLGVSGGIYKAAYDTTIGGGLQSWVSVSDTFSYVATNYMYWDAPGSGATMYLVPDGVTYTKWDVSAINLFSLTGGNVTIDSTSYVVFSVDGGAPVTRNFSGDQVLTTASTDMFSFFTDGTAITNVTSVKMVLTMDAGSLDTNINRLGFKSITLQASGGGGGGGGGNNAPVADLNGGGAGIDNTASFTEGGGAVDISPAATVTDLDTDTITTITIALTNDQDGVVEGLNVTGAAQNALTGVAGATDITLQDTISIAGATASVAEVQTFLRSVTYNNTATPPNTTNRNITVTINDGTENNNPVPAVTMSVSAAAPPPPPPNTPPVVDLDMGGPPGDTTASFTQGGGAVKIAPSAGVADLDLDTIKTITVTLTNNQDGVSEGLNVTGAAQNALTGVAGATDIALQNTITIAGANATLAEVQTFLQAITYNNTATPPTTTARTITVVVNDGTNPSNTATTTMSVAAAGSTLPPDYCEPPLRFENGLCVASELPTINSVSFEPGTYTAGDTVPVTILMNPLSAQLPGGLRISGSIANLAVSGLNYLGGNSFSAVFKVTKTGNPGARNYAGAADIPVNLVLSDVSARSNAFRSVITGVPNDVISFCPANASVSDLDLDKNGQFDDCKCNTGYRFNSDQTICEVYPQAIVLSESSLTLLEGGESASFTVTVAEDATDQTAIGTVTASAGLEILAGETGPLSNTDSSYTVIFRATDNDLKDGDRSGLIIVSGTIDGGNYSETLEVSIEDDEVLRFSASPTELTVVEGKSISTTVTATGLVEGDFVEVTVKVADPAQESLFRDRIGAFALRPDNPTFSLPFYPADNNLVDAGNTATISLSAKLTNESDPFNTQDLGEFASITVNITNDDLPDFSFSKSPVELNEGATDTFTVDLFSDVPAGVSFTVTNSDPNRATITPETFELTTAATNQTLTVSSTENLIDDPSTPVTFTITPTYNEKELTSKKVELNINDDDQAGVVLFHDGSVADPSTPLQLVEGGASRSFEIVLHSQPVSDVTVDFANGPFIGFSEGETPYSVTPSSLTFTADNWNTRQRVTASAPDNGDVRGDTSYNFDIAVRSEDAVYNALTVARRVVKVLEDDTAGLLVTQNGQAPDAAAELILEEGKTGQNYELALSARPTADVTISFADSTDRVVFNPSTLVFTPENYDTAQTLTLLALDDSIDQDDTVSATLSIEMASTDSNFNQSITDAAIVKIADNDVAGLAVTQDGIPVTAENASFQLVEGDDAPLEFKVALSSQPAANVDIDILDRSTDSVGVTDGALQFRPDNWDQPQTFRIRTVDDQEFEGLNFTGDFEVSVLSSDSRYSAFNGAKFQVTVVDNDRPVISAVSLRAHNGEPNYVPGDSVVADLTISPANVNFSTLNLTGTIGGIAVKDFKRQSAGNYTAVFDIPVPDSTVSCTDSNSALITGVTVTSTAVSPYPDSDAEKVVDGSGLTNCVHDRTLSNSALVQDTGPYMMTFDLGSVRQVNSFRLWNLFAQNKEGKGVKQATAYLSDDGASFTQDDVFTFEQEANGQGSEYSVGWTTRYIRFEFQSIQTQNVIDHHTEYGISEIQFFGGASSDSDSDSTSVSQSTDIAAADSIPVNLSLSSESTTYATYTQSIVAANDAILTTPATVSLTLDSAAAEGVEEGQSTNVSVTAVDAFGNPWPRALTIPISYAGSEASRDGGQFVALTEDQFDSVNGVMVPGGEAGADEANATELGGIGGATKVEVTGYSLSRYQEVRKPDVYSFTATDTATYSLSAQTSIGDRGFTIYPAGSDDSSDNYILNFITGYGQPTRDYKTFNLTAGETYIIRLLGYDGSGTYSFSLGIADFSAPDSVEIAASTGEATATIDIMNDQSTEPGSSGKGETITMKVDSAKLPDTAVAGANGTATIRIIDVPVPKILNVSIPNQVHVPGDEVTATLTVESSTSDFTTGEGGISGSIGGFTVSGLTRVSASEYQTTFTVSVDNLAESSDFKLRDRESGDKGIYLNNELLSATASDRTVVESAEIDSNTVIDGYVDRTFGGLHEYQFTVAADGNYTIVLTTPETLMSVGQFNETEDFGQSIVVGVDEGYNEPTQRQFTLTLSAGDRLWLRLNFSAESAYRLGIYSGAVPPAAGINIAASSDVPVNLTLTSDKGGAGSAYTTAISQDKDALLPTPAAINITLPTSGTEGETVTGTVTATDAFGNGWPKPLNQIALAYTGTASSEGDFSGPGSVSLRPANVCTITAAASSASGNSFQNASSAWVFNPSDPSPTLTLDLCEVQSINALELGASAQLGTNSFVREGVISYSADGETFTGGGSFSMLVNGTLPIDADGNILAVQHFISGSSSGSVSARYIRVELKDWAGTAAIRMAPLNLPTSLTTSANFSLALKTDSVSDPNETITVAVDTASLPATASAGSNASATLTITDVAPYVLKLTLDDNSLLDTDSGRIGVLSVQGYEGSVVYSRLSAEDSNGVCADNGDDFNSSFLPKADGTLELLDMFADFGSGNSPVPDEARFCLQATIGSGDEATSVAGAFVLDVYTTPVLTFKQFWHGHGSTLSTSPSTTIVMRDSMINDPNFDGNGIPAPFVPAIGDFDTTDSSLDERLTVSRFEFVSPADSQRNSCVTASSLAVVNAVFNAGITGTALNTPANIDLKESPANFDACVRVVLTDSAESIALEYEQIFTVRTVFELEQDIELTDLASSLNLDSSKVRFNSLTGVLTADFGGSQASCKPVSVTDAPAGRAAGSSINDDGLLEIVTEDGKLLTCSGAVEDLEAFKEAATPDTTLAAMRVHEQAQSREFSLTFNIACIGGDCESLVKNDICAALNLGAAGCARVIVNSVSATSNLRAPRSAVSALSSQDSQSFDVSSLGTDELLGESYFFRPSVMTLEVSSSQALGMSSQPASADSSLNTMHYVYEDDLGVRRSQEMLPVIARWKDVQSSIGILAGVEDVGIDDKGVLSISGGTLTLRYLPDYEVRVYGNFTGQASNGTIDYQSPGDVNGDGRNDVEIVHSDGLRQYLFQLPEQLTDSSSLSQ